MKTLAFERERDCLILLHSASSPSEEEWDEYLKFLGQYYADVTSARLLVITAGGGPDSAQRSRLDRLSKPHYKSMKVAVVTASTFARGLVKAFRLIHPFYRAFDPRALDDALAYLDVPHSGFEPVRSRIAHLRKSIGIREN